MVNVLFALFIVTTIVIGIILSDSEGKSVSTTENSNEDLKLSDVVDEVSDMVDDIMKVISEAMWEKSLDGNTEDGQIDKETNKWSIMKILDNVKYGYKAIVNFLPRIEMSRETFDNVIPT